MTQTKRRALVLVGHGSHLNGDSAAPVFAHVAALRALNLFDEVVPAFWKEEPSLREVIRATNAHEIIVVPLFISDGYFTEQVIPRELGLVRPTPNTISFIDGKHVIYTLPVGTHPAMTSVVEHRARTILGNETVPASDTALVIVGHGTPRNENSAKSIHYQVETLTNKGEYGEVTAIFMDEAPYVEEVLNVCAAPNIVVVPYFIADGFHTQEDIPEDLGIAENGSYPVPALLDGRRLWYAGAVGTDPSVVAVILERAREALTLTEGQDFPLQELVAARAHHAFAAWAREKARLFGQVLVRAVPDGWELSHVDDAIRTDLETLTDPFAAEHIARYDDEGDYRPLSTAPTLRHGWRLLLADDESLRHALDALYPAAVVGWYDEREGQLNPTPFFETAARQTGMYSAVNRISAEQARRAIRACCVDQLCLKRITWDLAPDEPLAVERGEGLIPCREACGILIGLARKVVLGDRAAPRMVDLTPAELETLQVLLQGTVDGTFEMSREGEVSDPANVRRLRLVLDKLTAADRVDPATPP
jgi:sirohydrochlorin cobaltochelatase